MAETETAPVKPWRRLGAFAVLALLLLLAAGTVWSRPQMEVSGPAGYTAEGVARFQAMAAEGEPCLLGAVNIRWQNAGPFSWTLPYTLTDIVVCGADGLPLAEQPDRMLYDQEAESLYPGAGIYPDRAALLSDYAEVELTELPGELSTTSRSLSALVLVESPLPEDAGQWSVKVEYRLLGLFPRSAEAALFRSMGGTI